MKFEPSRRLANKVAIITGAASGLGQATALACAAASAKVVCADINFAGAEETAKTARESGADAIAVMLDITDQGSTENTAAVTLKEFGTIDVLGSIAGIGGSGTAANVEKPTWDRIIAVNLTGVWLMARAVLPTMMQHKSGSIINLASVGALVGIPDNAAYGAAKGGAYALTKQMAVDYAPYNIRVNAICPGTVATPLVISTYIERGYIKEDAIEEGLRATAKRYPIGRYGRPEEIAGLAVYLASDESGFMTGAGIPIDGGLSAVGWQVGQ